MVKFVVFTSFKVKAGEVGNFKTTGKKKDIKLSLSLIKTNKHIKKPHCSKDYEY